MGNNQFVMMPNITDGMCYCCERQPETETGPRSHYNINTSSNMTCNCWQHKRNIARTDTDLTRHTMLKPSGENWYKSLGWKVSAQ